MEFMDVGPEGFLIPLRGNNLDLKIYAKYPINQVLLPIGHGYSYNPQQS